MNRIHNIFYNKYLYTINSEIRDNFESIVMTTLGDRYNSRHTLSSQIGDDFYRNLQALEAFYKYLRDNRHEIENRIKNIMSLSEIDLGIRWEDGRFIKSGAKLLDEKLTNDELHWLRNKQYGSVLSPFQKGLEHFLNAEKNPAFLSDVITDMYEALEALAKIVTGKDADLSANRELFVKTVKASEKYKTLLKDYIDYANDFRHASKNGKEKSPLTPQEVESFIYLTGLFLRLAMA